ncbi:conserved hypothetical protein [Candidatus Sulfopaludibacter sp. SbA3]|nr:conserved hypothetical protein [Candidatus Sulfopaludibacter sp. SbA3]
MAQPIPLTLLPKGPDPAERLEDALHKHTDAIVSALELLQLLHDRGVLELAHGLVGAGDQLVGILTAAAGTPESLRGMRNFILLTKFFASIPPDVLNSLVRAASEGAEREKAQRAPGVLQLLRRAGNENSRHAIAVTLDLLESVGKAL